MNTNLCILTGNLTKDPELRYSKSNEPITNFTIAVNGYNDRTEFVKVVTFKKRAETCHKWLSKGQKVCVVGALQIDNVKTGEEYKTYVSIIAESVEFLDSVQKDEHPEQPQEKPKGNNDNIEDDLPF